MAIDLNNLPTTAEDVEQPDYDNYTDAQEFPPPFPEGIYQFKQNKAEVAKFENGITSFILDHDVFDDTGNKIGSVAFDRISTKVFERQGVKVSMAADHLRALGITARPNSPRAWADAMISGNGETFKAATKWEGFCNHKGTDKEVKDSKQGFNVKGASKFPKNGNGEPASEMECPVCKGTVRARTRIDRRIPKS